VRQFIGRLCQIVTCHTFLFVSNWRSWSPISSSLYIVHVELWYQILRMRFHSSGAPEPPCVIKIICLLSIAGIPNTRIAKEFRIFTDSIMPNNLQSIAHQNCYQHLDSPETDPSLYISKHRGMERPSKRYRVDVSYPRTQLAYSRLTWSTPPSIASLSNEIQEHLISTLQSSCKGVVK